MKLEGYHVQAHFQSPMITNRTYKKWRAFWKNGFQRGTVWNFQTKKNQKIQSSHEEQNKRITGPRRQKLNLNHVARKKLSRIERNIKNKTVGTLQDKNKEVKSWPAHIFCNLGWSWHGQWRWQGYHVQAQFQSSMIINKTYKKWKALLNIEFQRGTVWELQTKKFKKTQSLYGEQNKRTPIPWKQKMNMNHVARKKLTEAKLKKTFRIKLFELCKTRTRTSSPDLFNFYVISADQDVVNETGRLPRAGAISKPHDYKQNVQKIKGLLKK